MGYKLFVQPQIALKEEKLLPPPPPPPDPTVPEFNKAVAVRKSGKMIEARDALYAFIERYPDSTKIDEAKDILGEINTDILLSGTPAPEKEEYIVQKGDVITRVALKLKVPGELIVRANNLQGPMLRIGQKLSVSSGEYSLVISRKRNKVTVLNKGKFFKQYTVLSWPPSKTKAAAGSKSPPAAKIQGKVTEKISWLNGGRVTFMDKGFVSATHWIEINIPGCTLHSVADDTSEQKPPGGGIRLTPDALDELAAMLSKNDPVTLE
jgi:LysM repeat protein